MASIVYSNEKRNSSAISASTKWFPAIDSIADLKGLLPESRAYFNYCKVTNSSTEAIKVTIGQHTIRIAGGDGFEWNKDTPVHFNGVIIENLDTINNIAINEITIEYARVV